MLEMDVSPLFVALSDPTRRHVVELLGAGPLPAGQLAKAVGTSPPAMSRHLRVLLRAGMVSDKRPADDARLRVFSLEPESVATVRAWLDRLQGEWDENLRQYKQHAERRSAR